VGDLLAAGADLRAVDPKGRTALALAAEKGRLEIVALLIEAGADPRSQDLEGATALVTAAAHGHGDVVDLLVGMPGVGEDHERVGQAAVAASLKGHEALASRLYALLPEPGLLVACALGDAERVRFLVEAGADTAVRRGDLTPLLLAGELGHTAIVTTLLATGSGSVAERERLLARAAGAGHIEVVEAAVVAGLPPDPADALAGASLNGHLGVVELLLSQGVNPNHGKGRALGLAVGRGRRDVALRLLEAGADPNLEAPLLTAASRREPEMAQVLLQAGADPGFKDPQGRTALMIAVRQGRIETAKLLLEAGADPTVKRDGEEAEVTILVAALGRELEGKEPRELGALIYDRLGERADLADAAAYGDLARVRALLEKGADPDPPGRRLQALALAAAFGHGDVVVALVAAGARLAAPADVKDWMQPLVVAAGAGHAQIVQTLVAAAAAQNPLVDPGSLGAVAAVALAAEGGHLEIVRALVPAVADPNGIHEDRTLLGRAAGDGEAELLEILLEAGADPDVPDAARETALSYAARHPRPAIVARLVEAGADLETRNGKGWTALMLAARHGRAGNIDALLAAGAAVSATDEQGVSVLRHALQSDRTGTPNRTANVAKLIYARIETPSLVEAISMGDLAVAQARLRSGADPTEPGSAALGAALDHPELIVPLVEAGVELETRDAEGRTALTVAARRGLRESVASLVRAGADTAARDEKRWTPLLHAADRGHSEVVRTLLQAGADPGSSVDEGDSEGWSPLRAAARRGRVEVVRILIEAGVDPRAQHPKQGSALMTAAHFKPRLARWLYERIEEPTLADAVTVGRTGTVNDLLRAGADPDHEEGGIPVLMLAAAIGHLEIVRDLLESGADVNAVKGDRWSVLMAAAGMDRSAVVEALLEAGADLTLTDERGWTALMAAANRGRLKPTELLLAAGADPHAENEKGKTALDLARDKKRDVVVPVLVEAMGGQPEQPNEQGP